MMAYTPRAKHGFSISPLCLGTVQLGMDYGIANQSGMPGEAQARELLRAAERSGVTLLDTARGYGLSEARIGAAGLSGMVVMTKCDALMDVSEQASRQEVAARVEKSVQDSCAALGLAVLPYVLLHRPEHFEQWGGQVWETLLALKAAGKIKRLGASVSSPAQALAALNVPHMEALQLPLHVLDARWDEVEAACAAKPEVLVLARSSLLQGVLTLPAAQWPVLENAGEMCALLDGWEKEFARAGRVDLCLAYVRALGWVDSIVLGMETQAQLDANLALFALPPLSGAQVAQVKRQRPMLPEAFLNPANWPKTKGHAA